MLFPIDWFWEALGSTFLADLQRLIYSSGTWYREHLRATCYQNRKTKPHRWELSLPIDSRGVNILMRPAKKMGSIRIVGWRRYLPILQRLIGSLFFFSVSNCRVAAGFPDSRTCLLHQKLQMLNVCMERRRIREGGLPFSMTGAEGEMEGREGSHESEDEFFDCSDEDEEGKIWADLCLIWQPWWMFLYKWIRFNYLISASPFIIIFPNSTKGDKLWDLEFT